jgi:hypothetical protein
MRYRLMATYRGVPYEAGIGPSEADVVLFAACPPPEDLGFEPATGHWRKQLRIDEVQALWESKPTGRFRGERCIVLDDLGDRLHIAYLGHDAYQAEQLGYWQVDRGVFELVTPREEVVDIVEERTDYPGRTAGGPPQGDEFSASPFDAPQFDAPQFDARPSDAPPFADPPFADPPFADPLSADPLSADPPFGAPVPQAVGPDPAQPTPAAAPGQDAASTKLADLAAATLAHLATMSRAAARDPAKDPARVPDRDLPLVRAQDPPHPGGPQTTRQAGSANGYAVHPVEFPVPAGPGNWPGTALGSGVAMPPPDEAPLPLEAAARRAASAATAAMRRERRHQVPLDPASAPGQAVPQDQAVPKDQAASQDQAAPQDEAGSQDQAVPKDQAASQDQAAPQDQPGPQDKAGPQDQAAPQEKAGPPPEPASPPRRRRTARKRVATQGIFSELAGLASIPPAAYAVGTEVDGAMCLLQTAQGYEVFTAVAGARHEVRSFQDEESAYFYLFGVLAADAVRTGRLAPSMSGEPAS